MLIHIGYHKTATTWLQQKVFANEALGFCTPWGKQAGLAVDLFVQINPFRFDATAAAEALRPEIEAAHARDLVPVLSSESLCGSPFLQASPAYSRTVADRLHAACPNARILLSIREQAASIVSHYAQEITVGGYQSIRKYIGETNLPPGWHPTFQQDHLEYDLLVKHYQDLFGSDAVLVQPLEMLRINPDRYLERLYSFCGLDPETSPDLTPSRRGYRATSLLFRRFCNSWNFGRLDWTRQRQPLSWAISHRLTGLIDKTVPAFVNAWAHRRLTRGLPDSLSERYADSNARLESLTGLNLAALGYAVAKGSPTATSNLSDPA